MLNAYSENVRFWVRLAEWVARVCGCVSVSAKDHLRVVAD